MSRLVVGLSGGVDSSVAALLLRRRGEAVTGLFMKNWEEDDAEGYCAAAADLADAEAVARALDIPLRSVNFAAEYWERVFARFLAEYRAGRTPNPDVLCNSEVKFAAFLDHALGLGAEAIATGHYARVEGGEGCWRLLRGVDRDKDQSYFLHRLSQGQLARSRFPLGGLTKARVRALAAEAGLATSAKRDSTGICFIGERPFREFLARFLPAQPGEIRTPEGQLLGEHQGLMYHTLGQRRGLGIGGRRGAGGEPWFVAAKDLERNVLVVVQGSDHPLLWSRGLAAGDAHWVAAPPPRHAPPRHQQNPQTPRGPPKPGGTPGRGGTGGHLPRPPGGGHPGPVRGLLPGGGVPRRGGHPGHPAPRPNRVL